MCSIYEIANKALKTGWLSGEDQEKLRNLLKHNYPREDLEAFMNLQKAFVRGEVKQECRH